MYYGVYIHIPFCRRKCFYCDFPSRAGRRDEQARYVRALCGEIAARGLRMRSRGTARTLYLGGGTPTALERDALLAVLDAARARFAFADDAEITVEANPGTIDEAYLAALRAHGANRLSLGVQTLDDARLKAIGRLHTARDARAAVHLAHRAGFDNVSVDLMYGLPGQTPAGFRAELREAAALGAAHLSVYGLAVEEGTAFARWRDEGRLALPGEEDTEEMYDTMVRELPRLGYARYEISSFARPGRESRHNLGYWRDVPYLGLGAAAHSYLDGRRTENEPDIAAYIAAVSRGLSPAREEAPPSEKTHMEEYCFLALRTVDGISRAAFADTFRRPIERVYAEAIRDMTAQGLLEAAPSHIRLTPRGMKFGNRVFAAFLL